MEKGRYVGAVLVISCLPALILCATHRSSLANTQTCDNILVNMTRGSWVKKVDLLEGSSADYQRLEELEAEVYEELRLFRIRRGIHTRLWRDDRACGYKNLQSKPKMNLFGKPVAGWCDYRSDYPCCSDKDNGTCSIPSEATCSCPRCVDMRRIHYPEVSEWIPADSRCYRRNYTASQACELLSKYKGFYFVGDSFLNKMCIGLIMTLANDPVRGAPMNYYADQDKEFCIGLEQFRWRKCRLLNGLINEQLSNSQSSPCGGKLPFEIHVHSFSNLQRAGRFLVLVKNLAGKNDTVLLAGVGLHMNCEGKAVIQHYLGPAVRYLEGFHKRSTKVGAMRWPRLIWILPDRPGLLKPPSHLKNRGRKACDVYSAKLLKYCRRHDIDVLDFREVTTGVQSYDGTHHGRATNLMKVQIFLNVFDQMHIGR